MAYNKKINENTDFSKLLMDAAIEHMQTQANVYGELDMSEDKAEVDEGPFKGVGKFFMKRKLDKTRQKASDAAHALIKRTGAPGTDRDMHDYVYKDERRTGWRRDGTIDKHGQKKVDKHDKMDKKIDDLNKMNDRAKAASIRLNRPKALTTPSFPHNKR